MSQQGTFISIQNLKAQNGICNRYLSLSGEIYTVDAYELRCLARTSEKEKILVYIFATWCKPCRYRLKNAIDLAKDYDLDFYVLISEEEDSDKELKTIDYLHSFQNKHNCAFNILNLKDENGHPDKKLRNFVRKITPSKFEAAGGRGKFLIIDKSEKPF